MKTLLCCIARKENRYIREFVEYYKKIGFTHICLYDDNREGEEHFEDVISDYLESGFVNIIKVDRGEKLLVNRQVVSYEDCYRRYGGEYDWIAFFDCDEFLFFDEDGVKDIGEALSWSGYDGYDAVMVNWMLYTDGGMLSDDGRPVLERFVEPILPYDRKRSQRSNVCNNDLLKIILRGGLDEVKLKTVHMPVIPKNICNNAGQKIAWVSGTWPVDYTRMHLKHFRCKTVDEFVWKIGREYPDAVVRSISLKHMFMTLFFQDNEVTREKLEYIRDKYEIDLFKFYRNVL